MRVCLSVCLSTLVLKDGKESRDLLALFTVAGDLDFSEVECVHG